LLRNRLEVADCSLDGPLVHLLSSVQVAEHRQGQGEFVSEQVAELFDVVKIFC